MPVPRHLTAAVHSRTFKNSRLARRPIYAVVRARPDCACVVVAKSTVPGVKLGLFVGEAVKTGAKLAICGGQPLINVSLLDVPPEILRHIRSIEGGEMMIAGHLHGRYDLDHYVKLGHVASFVNSLSESKLQNAKFSRVRGEQRTHIDINGVEITQPDNRTPYLEATRDIPAGVEIFADYARNHKRKFGVAFYCGARLRRHPSR